MHGKLIIWHKRNLPDIELNVCGLDTDTDYVARMSEADSNDIIEYTRDEKPITGMFGFSYSDFMCYT